MGEVFAVIVRKASCLAYRSCLLNQPPLLSRPLSSNSIAYYLAKRHSLPCTIVDPVGIAPAASGKAGGFLARDWSDGSPLQELQRRSFNLHAEQAAHLGAERIDYRRLSCVSVACGEAGGGKPKGQKLKGVEWADIDALGSRVLGGTDTIAQVSPCGSAKT